MARKKVEIFVEVHNEKEFETILKSNIDQLICAEVYSYAFGFCTALDRLFSYIKLDWSDGKIILLKVPADEIECLKRFRNQSEPVYMFILNMKVTKVFRGVDMVKFGEVAKKQLQYYRNEQAGLEVFRDLYELDEPTADELIILDIPCDGPKEYKGDHPISSHGCRKRRLRENRAEQNHCLEKAWINARELEKKQEEISFASRREARQAARKRHRAELMVPHLTDLNFVFYWPHCLNAHPELYERWDVNNIVMVARETIEVTDEMVADIFYAGDAPLNEASLYMLRTGPALALCLRLLSTDVCFTKLVRRIVYEDIRVPPYDDTTPIEGEVPMTTAFDYYKSYSLTKEQIIEQRIKDKEKKKEEIKEKRIRRLSVMQRLARQAITDAMESKRLAREKKQLELLKAGDLVGLEKFKNDPDDDDVDIVVPEELADEEENFSLEEEDVEEYYPPPGLLIPGFYAPPNNIAKANGLAVLFPKLVHERVTPQPEFLPPHVLVMLELYKRFKAIEAIAPYKHALIHMGIFQATTPYDSVHIAYTNKQFNALDKSYHNLEELKIAFMLSVECDVPVLQLVELNPYHVSRDKTIGEDECAAMFSVDYCDHYNQFEDFV